MENLSEKGLARIAELMKLNEPLPSLFTQGGAVPL
jgi:hypothetical protein